jgi:hypothetical protein
MHPTSPGTLHSVECIAYLDLDVYRLPRLASQTFGEGYGVQSFVETPTVDYELHD